MWDLGLAPEISVLNKPSKVHPQTSTALKSLDPKIGPDVVLTNHNNPVSPLLERKPVSRFCGRASASQSEDLRCLDATELGDLEVLRS